MKRKLLSIVSLLLAVMMVIPMGIFVYAEGKEETTSGIEIYEGSQSGKKITGDTIPAYFTSGNTFTLEATGGDGSYNWYSKKTSVATVSGNGATATVTPVKSGIVEICVEDNSGNSASVTYNMEENTVESLIIDSSYTKDYIVGQSFDVASLKVKAKYKDGSTSTGYAPINELSVEPSGALKSSDKKVKVWYKGVSDTLDINVSEKTIKSVDISYMKTQDFTVGDALPEMEVKVTYNDNSYITVIEGFDTYVNGNKVSSSYTFKSGDNSIYVIFNGVQSDTKTIKVSDKSSTTDSTYFVEMNKAPTKTTYRVGDKFDATGMTVKVYQNISNSKTLLSDSDAKVAVSTYTITEADLANKNYITVPVKITILSGDNKNKIYSADLKVTGLTIKEAAGELTVYEITDVEMNESSYPVGYKFSLDDIDYMYYRESKSGKQIKVSGYDLLNAYTNDSDLEVLTNKNDKTYAKSSKYMYTLEDDDLFTNEKTDTQYAYLRLSVDKESYDFTIKVGGSGVYYYYDDELIATYEDIDEALEYTMEQDKDVKDDFDLDKVKDSKEILLKLGEDQEVSQKTELELVHNVKIDLAGHKLEFYTDTVEITKANKDYTLTITNTSSTSAKFTYEDEDVEITLAKNDKLVFEYDSDIPGIYTLTLDVGSNGKVTSTPAADKNDSITIGQGSDVKFTITPSTGYELDTLKVDTKSVSEKDYTKSSSGVITYTLKSVAKSQKVSVTFKKTDTTKNWTNPFTDVSSSDSYYSAVKFVYENSLFKGTTTTKFSPDTTMTRAMFVTVLGRLAGVDVSRFKTSSYSDVPINSTTSWYAPYVEWATQMGIVEGYGDGTFGPDNKITHQQMYVLMYKYSLFVENKKISLSGTSINASDADEVADWAKNAVMYASQQNFLVKVSTSRIDPKGEAKRSELAQLLEKYCDVVLDWNNK
jgi:hypothetical protein